MRHKAEMVIFEAARAICNMKDVTSRSVRVAVNVVLLQSARKEASCVCKGQGEKMRCGLCGASQAISFVI